MAAPIERQSKGSSFATLLSILIAVAAFLAFIFLNRMMAPPFPNFGTNSPMNQIRASTNSATK